MKLKFIQWHLALYNIDKNGWHDQTVYREREKQCFTITPEKGEPRMNNIKPYGYELYTSTPWQTSKIKNARSVMLY